MMSGSCTALPLALLKHRVAHPPEWLHGELDWEVDARGKVLILVTFTMLHYTQFCYLD